MAPEQQASDEVRVFCPTSEMEIPDPLTCGGSSLPWRVVPFSILNAVTSDSRHAIRKRDLMFTGSTSNSDL